MVHYEFRGCEDVYILCPVAPYCVCAPGQWYHAVAKKRLWPAHQQPQRQPGHEISQQAHKLNLHLSVCPRRHRAANCLHTLFTNSFHLSHTREFHHRRTTTHTYHIGRELVTRYSAAVFRVVEAISVPGTSRYSCGRRLARLFVQLKRPWAFCGHRTFDTSGNALGGACRRGAGRG